MPNACLLYTRDIDIWSTRAALRDVRASSILRIILWIIRMNWRLTIDTGQSGK